MPEARAPGHEPRGAAGPRRTAPAGAAALAADRLGRCDRRPLRSRSSWSAGARRGRLRPRRRDGAPSSARSARGSMGCRSRSSSRPLGSACSRLTSCATASGAGSTSWAAGRATCPTASGLFATRSPGATSCSMRTSGRCSRSSPSSRRRRSRTSKRCASASTRWPAWTSSTASARSSTRAWSGRPTNGEGQRLSMLETIHEYASGELERDADLASAARGAHAEHYASFATRQARAHARARAGRRDRRARRRARQRARRLALLRRGR